MQERKGRNENIDFVKAIGICLVVFGHAFGGGLFALKTYHMPLFFFVAGLLTNDKEKMRFFLEKRIRRLYIPFLLYEIFFLCIHNFLYDFGTAMFFASIISKVVLSVSAWRLIHLKKKTLLAGIFILSICLIYGGMLNGRDNRLNSKMLQWAGENSLLIYLIHDIFFYNLPFDTGIPNTGILIIGIVVTLVGVIVYNGSEKYMKVWLKRILL